MKLLKIALVNYQGIRERTLEPNGHDMNIYGDNATGKTTIGNAISFLLTGKPMGDIINYSIKTRGSDGQDIHYIDHSVEGTLQLDNGRIVTLKRMVSEDWRQTRGSNAEELKGNTTSYFIDEVPTKESDFTMFMVNICDIDRIKMLTQPSQFAAGIPWETRRKILLQICGDVSDDDIITVNPALSKLPEFLTIPGTDDQRYTVEDFKVRASSKMSDLNSEIKKIPIRVDEAKMATPELTPNDKTLLTLNIGQLSTSQYLKKSQIEKLKEGGNDIVREQINDAMAEMSDARRLHQEIVDKEHETSRAASKILSDSLYELTIQRQNSNNKVTELLGTANVLSDRRDRLLRQYKEAQEEYDAESARQWIGATICPVCTRPIPEDAIEAAKTQFNLTRSTRLEDIQKRLDDINKQGASCSKSKIDEMNDAANLQGVTVKRISDQVTALNKEISESGRTPVSSFETTDAFARISRKLATLRSTGDKVDTVTAEKITTLQSELEAIDAQINDYMQATAKFKTVETQKKRIADLTEKQKDLAKEYEHYQQGVFLCEEFIREKVKALDERINSRFKTVKFKLFKQQMNGGLQECCEVLIPSPEGNLVEFKDANHSAQINAGLEIIGTLSEHWETSMPVIIDNRESITKLIPTKTQVISLIVSEADKKLRVEAI
jgi:hypothetical protein